MVVINVYDISGLLNMKEELYITRENNDLLLVLWTQTVFCLTTDVIQIMICVT